MKRQALGRGLSALFGEAPRELPREAAEALVELKVEDVAPARSQPRTHFDEQSLKELARSIQAKGVVQPIVVRPDANGGYQIVAGERRWRAARSLGLETIPALVREVGEPEALELALVENLQREDLNAMEQARAYESLLREHGLKQDELAQKVGKDRSSIANALRLLRLPQDVQAELEAGRLSMGHARALLSLESPARMRQVARRVLSEGLSVRQVEELVRAAVGAGAAVRPRGTPRGRGGTKDVHDRAAEKALSSALKTRVEIRRAGKGGRIQIRFYSEEDLMRLYDRLVDKEQAGR
jgi:ParB family chromosome partitioning protein